MPLSKELIGRSLASYEFVVERGKVREFCRAIGETNPLYLEQEFAKKAGYKDTLLPPTFQTVFVFWGYPQLMQDLQKLGVDTGRILHMKENYRYHKPIHPGMLIDAKVEIKDVKVGKMDMLTFGSAYLHSNDLCMEAEMTILLRPE